MGEFISELRAAWVGNRRRKFYQSTRGIMTPEERIALEEEFDRKLAEHDRQVAEKAWDRCVDEMPIDPDWKNFYGDNNPYRAEAYRKEGFGISGT